MRAYIITTGAVFALVTIAHLWRIAEEGLHVVTNPFFVLTTLISAGIGIWAWRLLRPSSRS